MLSQIGDVICGSWKRATPARKPRGKAKFFKIFCVLAALSPVSLCAQVWSFIYVHTNFPGFFWSGNSIPHAVCTLARQSVRT